MYVSLSVCVYLSLCFSLCFWMSLTLCVCVFLNEGVFLYVLCSIVHSVCVYSQIVCVSLRVSVSVSVCLIHTHTPNMVLALELFTSVLGKVKPKK